jgi:cell pole-organizing protein PopZ
MASKEYEKKYTKPELRERLKEEIKNSDKGGKPGQWSARKSQFLVQEYEKKGGDYKKSHKDASARSLEAWTEQDWQTIEGDAGARKDNKTKRYLPRKVWEQLNEQEKKEAEKTKTSASRDGKQYVPWTPAIKKAFEKANIATDKLSVEDDEPSRDEIYEKAKSLDIAGRSKMSEQELRKAVNSHQRDALQELSRDELYQKAQQKNIEGRSQMSKKELVEALSEF